MSAPLNILIVEDSADDAELTLIQLRRDGFKPTWKRVDTEADYLASLGPGLDLIISDFGLPQFSTPQAIHLLKESGLDIPLIIVSGTIGEERAVECLRNGATDYVPKDRLNRLGPVVHRALDEARHRVERQRTEKESLLRTAFFEAQVHSVPDGILVVDSQRRKILQNQQMIELFKIPECIVNDEDDSQWLQYLIERVKNPEQFSRRVAYLYNHPDEIGRDEIEMIDGRLIDRYSAPVRDKVGEYYGRIWTFRDITERRRLEEQLRQSQKMEAIGKLAGGVAHDFNNSLSVIQGYVEDLRSGELSPAEIKESLEEIAQATANAANLTHQLLAFSRKQVIQLRPLSLNDVVGKLAKMLKRILGEDISLCVHCGSNLPLVQADAGMMDQVLMNLAVNARDAMPNGGKLTICTFDETIGEEYLQWNSHAKPGSYTCLSVADTGEGIAPEILQHIFEPFFTTKGVDKGTGLGLATVYGIVRQHRGWIHVCSEVGKGTVFRIYLPRGTETAEKGLGVGKDNVPTGTETILLVEDEPALRALNKKLLARAGYTVIEACSGVAAMEIWNEQRAHIDLVLTDVVMPDGVSGPELVKQLRRKKPSLRVIFVSGYIGDSFGKNQLIEAENFLQKPCPFGDLARMVRDVLDKP